MSNNTTRRQFMQTVAAAGLTGLAATTAVASTAKFQNPKFIGWRMDAATGQQYVDGKPVVRPVRTFREITENFINDIRAERGEPPLDMSIWSAEAVSARLRRILETL